MSSNVTPALEQLKVPIGEPVLHPQNYRQGDVEGIATSLTRFGQLKPIVVQASTMRVVAGNHTLKAAQSLGWDEVAAAVVAMPDEEAEAYLVADNRHSDNATNDDTALAALLERMMLAGRLEGTGYSPDDVDDMLSSMDALPEVDAPAPEGTQGGTTDEALAERFKNRSQVALRQFVLMYDQDTATEVEQTFRKLERAWGVTQARDVVLEALRRAAADPPVEGLTVEEAERANIVPEAEPEPGADDVAQPVEPVAPVSTGQERPQSGDDSDSDLTHLDGVTDAPVVDEHGEHPDDDTGAATTAGAAGDTGVAPLPPVPAEPTAPEPVDIRDVHDAAPES